jgi:uncharacterized membrane protein YphA (DoxX/SURF4 family)
MAQTVAKVQSGGGASPQAKGLAVVRIMLGVFFLFEAFGKISWLSDSGILAGRLNDWASSGTPIARTYINTVCVPGVTYFARLVPIGEFSAGVALLLGAWTRVAALLAFLMVLNFHIASSAIFKYSFLTNGYALPVLSGLLGLVIGGAKLPWGAKR